MGKAGRLLNRQIKHAMLSMKNPGKGDLLPHTAGLIPDSVLNPRLAAHGRAWNNISKGMVDQIADLWCQQRSVAFWRRVGHWRRVGLPIEPSVLPEEWDGWERYYILSICLLALWP